MPARERGASANHGGISRWAVPRSGAEAVRTALGTLWHPPPTVLLLDEPTNYRDPDADAGSTQRGRAFTGR